jgi:hypothetical protein
MENISGQMVGNATSLAAGAPGGAPGAADGVQMSPIVAPSRKREDDRRFRGNRNRVMMAAPAADISATIVTNATSPATATADGVMMAQVPIPNQIQADRYGKAVSAMHQRRRGMMFSKIIPAGAMSDSQGTGFGGLDGFGYPGGVW